MALLAAGAGCGGSGSSGGDSFPTPGRALTPGNTPQTRYRVERLFGSTDKSRADPWRGRHHDSAWWESRSEEFGKLNNRGEVAASMIESNIDLGPPAIFRGGQFVTSGVPAPPAGYDAWDKALDLNDRGQLLVWRYISHPIAAPSPYDDTTYEVDRLQRLFMCENGTARAIELPYTYIHYAGINNRGHIAGTGVKVENQTDQGEEKAFLWRDGRLEEFGPRSTYINNINDAGQMLGTIYAENQPPLTLWQDTETPVDLNFPRRPVMSYTELNQEGAVVATLDGYRKDNNPTYLWTPTLTNGATGTATQIMGLPRAFVCEDMNVRRDIVGSAYDLASPPSVDHLLRACLMRSGASEADDLNALIPVTSGVFLEQAYGINDAGQITCIGRADHADPYSERAVYLLTPDGNA